MSDGVWLICSSRYVKDECMVRGYRRLLKTDIYGGVMAQYARRLAIFGIH